MRKNILKTAWEIIKKYNPVMVYIEAARALWDLRKARKNA